MGKLLRGPASWEDRRSVHVEELRMELVALRMDVAQYVARATEALDQYEAILNEAAAVITTPPPTSPAGMAKIVPIRRVA